MAPKSKLQPGVKKVKTRAISGTVRRNIDYSKELHERLESASDDLNVSSQALVKIALQEWLDRYTMAKHFSKAVSK